MKLRVLDAASVIEALPMAEAIEAMQQAFVQLSKGEVSLPLRSRIQVPGTDGVVLFMPAALHQSGELAIKMVSVYPENFQRDLPTIHALVLAADSRTGQPQAVLEGASLTAIRTGAASGAATDALARQDASAVAIYGSGVQARTQLEAVCTVRQIDTVWVYGLDEEGVGRFVHEMAGKGPIPADIRLAASPEEPLEHADVICTATTSHTPVFSGKELRPGTHINAIGAFTPSMRELDSEAVRKAYVVVDSRQAALEEAGDLIIPVQGGEIGEDWIQAELGEVLGGNRPGRTDQDQITLFKSVGVAVQDAVAAGRALERAEELGLGQVIEL